MSAWQPIETAPKDGRLILAFGKGPADPSAISFDMNAKLVPTVRLTYWHGGFESDSYELDDETGLYRKKITRVGAGWRGDRFCFDPTHWIDIPETPEPIANAAGSDHARPA